MTPDPIPQPDHGAAGFCTDHGQAADRPTTVAEAVEVAYRAHLEARKGAPLAPGEFEATRSRVETKWMAAALEAVPLICLAVIRPLGDSRTLHKDFREAAGISRGLYSSVGMMMSTVVV